MLWIVIVLMMLDNLGVNITALVASLGIGGIAVALAVQNVLGDLFASLSIVLDKPFVVGDFIIVDKFLGTVEHVGLKTTRLRSLGGEQIVFSNGDLLKSRLQNMTRMARRRVVLAVSVAHATPTDKLRAIPPLLAELVSAQSPVTLERAHFTGPSGTAMNFEVIYWVETADYIRFMDVQQEIALQMIDRFRAMDIALAVPLQITRVHGDDAAPLSVRIVARPQGLRHPPKNNPACPQYSRVPSVFTGMDPTLDATNPPAPMTEQRHGLAQVVERERRRLYDFIRRRVASTGDAEDILQDVFYEFVRACSLPEPIGQVGAWLVRVARNRIVDGARKKREEALNDEDDEDPEASYLERALPTSDDGPEAAYRRARLLDAILAALDALPANEREVFVAHEIDGLSFNDLATQTGVNLNTLLGWKRRAVIHLRTRLHAEHDDFL